MSKCKAKIRQNLARLHQYCWTPSSKSKVKRRFLQGNSYFAPTFWVLPPGSLPRQRISASPKPQLIGMFWADSFHRIYELKNVIIIHKCMYLKLPCHVFAIKGAHVFVSRNNSSHSDACRISDGWKPPAKLAKKTQLGKTRSCKVESKKLLRFLQRNTSPATFLTKTKSLGLPPHSLLMPASHKIGDLATAVNPGEYPASPP